MTINFNSMLNFYNNPFINGSMNSSVQMPANIFGNGFNLPALPSMPTMPVMPTPIDFSKIFANIDFSRFNCYASNTSFQGNVQEGKCKPKVKLDQAFLNRVKQISAKIGCNYKDLLAIMNSESGLNSKAVNKNGGATGLIQFMPSTAKSLGTTTDELRNMTPIQQLDYVEKFLVRTKKSSALRNKAQLSAGDLYALVFLPARAGNEVLTSQGEKYYTPNKGTDENRDGQITKTDLSNRLMRKRVDESIFLA